MESEVTIELEKYDEMLLTSYKGRIAINENQKYKKAYKELIKAIIDAYESCDISQLKNRMYEIQNEVEES